MKLLNSTETAKLLGVNVHTIRRWDKEGKFKPYAKTKGGHRRYSQGQIDECLGEEIKKDNEIRVFIYARVSTNKQKESGNLVRQKSRLMEYCVEQGYKITGIYEEVGSGINENRRQLHKMLDNLEDVDKIIIEYKDRLARFGFNYLIRIASAYNVEVEIVEDIEDKALNEEMVQDLISIITSFSARIYGARGGKKVKNFLDNLHKEGDTSENNSIS